MMKTYRLNLAGQQAIAEIVRDTCRAECLPSAFFADAEAGAESNVHSMQFEIGSYYTLNKLPKVIALDPAWFDMPQHTPGPWHIRNGELQSVNLNGDGDYVANIEVYTRADARLIAAAPELYAALQELVGRCDGDEGMRADGSNIQTIKAHAVLARIAGE